MYTWRDGYFKAFNSRRDQTSSYVWGPDCMDGKYTTDSLDSLFLIGCLVYERIQWGSPYIDIVSRFIFLSVYFRVCIYTSAFESYVAPLLIFFLSIPTCTYENKIRTSRDTIDFIEHYILLRSNYTQETKASHCKWAWIYPSKCRLSPHLGSARDKARSEHPLAESWSSTNRTASIRDILPIWQCVWCGDFEVYSRCMVELVCSG